MAYLLTKLPSGTYNTCHWDFISEVDTVLLYNITDAKCDIGAIL